MKICMVISTALPPQEGVGHYVWNLSRYLVGQGHSVQVITRGQRGKPPYEVLQDIAVWRPCFYPVYPLHVHLHGFFVRRLVRRIEAEVDVFHLHSPLPPPIQSKRPSLLTIHSMMLPDAKARKVNSLFDLLVRVQSPVSASVERQLIKTSQSVTAVSTVAARYARDIARHYGHCVQVTWNGVDTDFFTPLTQDSLEPFTLLFVGRLVPGKGLEDLVAALKLVLLEYPQTRLRVAGDGILRNRLVAWIEQNEMAEHIELLGRIDSRDTLRNLYRKAQIFILPSHHESLPTVVLEAMACGTPVIATRVGSVPDVITDCVNGLVVSPHAPIETSRAICRLLGDAALRSKLSSTAPQIVRERFSWQVVGGNYARCYAALSGGRAG